MSSFTGGQDITMVCRRRGNVVSIIFVMRGRFFSVFLTSSSMVCLNCSRLKGSFPWGKLGRKFNSARLGLLMLECEVSFSGLLLLLFPAFYFSFNSDLLTSSLSHLLPIVARLKLDAVFPPIPASLRSCFP